MLLAPGEVFAGFTIERELGAGGMGVVYLARHPRLPRRVALKLLRTDLGADPSFVGRFRREAETVARLDHPNIVAIDDSGADGGMLWISMRFIDGDTAAGALAGYDAGMPPERAVHIIERVASALDFAHRQQIVHRDVKPANILLTQDADGEAERVFLTDFGVAKAMGEIEAQATALTQAGGVVATLDYAAPEQIEGKQLDGRCDVYALGCVLYKLLTGVIPYPGETLAAKVYARMHRLPPAPTDLVPDLPQAFDQVIAKALAMDRGARYQTCKALAVAARAALGSGESARSDTDDRTVVAGTTSTERIDPPDADATRRVAPPDPLSRPVGPRTNSERSGPPTLTGHPDDAPRHRGRAPGRSWLAAGILVMVAAIVVGVVLAVRKESIAGSGSVTGGTSRAATSQGATSGSATSSSPPGSKASTVGTPPAGNTALPVAGLPQSIPLSAGTIVVSRQHTVNGKAQFALYPVDADNGTIGAAITAPTGYPQNPLIALQRGSIIYLQGDAANQNTVRTVAPGGGGDRLLFGRPAGCLRINRPAWNPKNTQQLAIACTSKDAARILQLVDLKGMVSRTLPVPAGLFPGDDLAFSPDGKSIVYWGSTSATAGDGRLYTQSTDGVGRPRAITPDGSHDADPDYSPDGSQIAFRAIVDGKAQIAVVPVGGGTVDVLTSTASSSQGPVFSPDGRRIAYKNNLGADGTVSKVDEVWVLDVTAPHHPKALVVGDAGLVIGSPAWGNR